MAGTLAITIVVGSIGMSGTKAYADVTASQKEEVIYIMTDASGSVSTVDAVNIFGKGSVTDYGTYSSVKMLNTTDSIKQDGDKVAFSTDKDKVYYQGTMENAEIPWNIKFTYTLDGKEIAPEDLAGKSGKLTIGIKIDKNNKCEESFYEAYALQAALTLDTEKCTNIQADGATIANVGADKQISYTILPGKGLDAEITADVTDFEMDAATINGIKLNLDMDIDDDELMDKVTDIMDAAKKLDKGAAKISDGTSDLLDGGNSLSDGASTLYEGVDSLNDGIGSLNEGVTSMQSAINKVNKNSKSLTDGSATVKEGINNAYKGVNALTKSLSYDSYKATMKANGLDVDQLQAGNTQAITTLTAQVTELSETLKQIQSIPGYEQSQEYQAQAAQIQAQVESLKNIITLLQGNNGALTGTSQYLDTAGKGASKLESGLKKMKTSYATLDTGINNYTDGVGAIADAYGKIVSGSSSLASGSKDLLDGSVTLKDGASDLYDGIGTLKDGTDELKDGTGEFYDKTKDMDTQVEDAVDDMIDSVSGGDYETVSFVSDKNENVEAVQFVIKTSAIEKEEETVEASVDDEKLNVWQKFIKLFK